MNRKSSFMEKVTQFISGNGFYLVLLVCVAAIGISGYFLVRSVMEGGASVSAVGDSQLEEEASQPVMHSEPMVSSPVMRPSVNPEKEVENDPVQAGVSEPEGSPVPSASVSPSPQVSASPEPSQEPEESKRPVALVFTWPVNGPVIASFSVETLLYDETMLDWRVHEGLDLAASEGTRVLCTAAGTVSEVYEDELMGVTVVIDHGEGLVSVYSNLEAEPSVEVGDRVYTGDILGAVGTTAAAESGRQPHLHFAMYKDDLPVDPETYLPID